MLGGRPRLLWTTFTPHQIDLDVHDPAARAYLSRVLRRLAECGVTLVRLDAVGYTVKQAGTSCFLTPETFAFVDDLVAEAHGLGLEALAEVHAHHHHALAAAAHVDRVYDFTLAPLVLHAVFTGDAAPLRRWLALRPSNTVTVLDTHDGLGMIDAGPGDRGDAPGLLSTEQIAALVRRIGDNSGGTSVASRVPSGVYQVSCTLYDAVGRDDETFLLARALQLFVPGIPQVYYVGLLAGRNAAFSGDAREINRRRYTLAEADEAVRQPVVAETAGARPAAQHAPGLRGRVQPARRSRWGARAGVAARRCHRRAAGRHSRAGRSGRRGG